MSFSFQSRKNTTKGSGFPYCRYWGKRETGDGKK